MSVAEQLAIDLSVDLETGREAVWRALTDPAEIPRWLAPSPAVVPGPGGSVDLSWGEGMTSRNVIELWLPPERLVLANTDSGLSEQYEITARRRGTRLHLRHSGFSSSPEHADMYDAIGNGWQTFFRMLQFELGRHAGQPYRNVTAFAPLRDKRDDAWERIVRPGCLARKGLPPLRTGDPYELELPSGLHLRGAVVHCSWPGYVVLSATNIGDSLFALMCERNSEGSFLTVTWILNGPAVRLHDELQSEWARWVVDRASESAAGFQARAH